jgi:hypothetical protein
VPLSDSKALLLSAAAAGAGAASPELAVLLFDKLLVSCCAVASAEMLLCISDVSWARHAATSRFSHQQLSKPAPCCNLARWQEQLRAASWLLCVPQHIVAVYKLARQSIS